MLVAHVWASPAGKKAKELAWRVRFSPVPFVGAVATSTEPSVTRINLWAGIQCNADTSAHRPGAPLLRPHSFAERQGQASPFHAGERETRSGICPCATDTKQRRSVQDGHSLDRDCKIHLLRASGRAASPFLLGFGQPLTLAGAAYGAAEA